MSHVGLHARAHLNEDPFLANAIGLDDVQPPEVDFLRHQALHGGCHMLNRLVLHMHRLLNMHLKPLGLMLATDCLRTDLCTLVVGRMMPAKHVWQQAEASCS